jgi:hypothetical protein
VVGPAHPVQHLRHRPDTGDGHNPGHGAPPHRLAVESLIIHVLWNGAALTVGPVGGAAGSVFSLPQWERRENPETLIQKINKDINKDRLICEYQMPN